MHLGKFQLTVLVVAIWIAVAGGCASSRWAMDDPDYAAKYQRPYEAGEKVPRMAKQMIDARHVAGKGGPYVGIGAATDPAAGAAEIGVFNYAYPWVSAQAGLSTLLGTGQADWYTAVNGRLRVQTPTRLAPFAGVGVTGGWASRSVDADRDGIDNDDDLAIDELGEEKKKHRFLGAMYPEAGVHFWLNSRWRLSGSSAYYVTTDGRSQDFWFHGISLGWLPGP